MFRDEYLIFFSMLNPDGGSDMYFHFQLEYLCLL